MNYVAHLLFLIGLYAILVYSLNLLWGLGGLASFAHAAFYAVGAYSYALVAKAGVPATIALVAAAIVGCAFAWCVATFVLRFRGDVFIFVTIALQIIVFVVLYNWIALTNGPYGISDIPALDVRSISFAQQQQYVAIVAVVAAIVLWLLFCLYVSPFGSVVMALRDDELAAEALGINARHVYRQALVVSGGVAAAAGALYAGYVTYIDPTSFTLRESIFQITILLLGGAGNRRGPIIGVVILVLLPEGLRFVGLPDSVAANVREIIYGLILVGLMYFRPRGIAGNFGLR